MLKRTPLYQKHVALNAKMVPFAGWEMPVCYPAGIIAEHKAVRTSCGMFDVGHMGLIKISGSGGLSFLNKIGTNDVSKLENFSSQYSILCNERGGVVDDVLIYRLPEYFIVVTNAVNTDKVLGWVGKHAVNIDYVHMHAMTLLAIQGPRAEDVVVELFGDENIGKLKRNHCLQLEDIIVSRTGYTGEDGFELFVPAEKIAELWDRLIEMQIQPCGLGARDTLRLEAAFPLYGHEYKEETTPLEAGYSWVVKFNKGDFIGREALLEEKQKGIPKKLAGIVLSEKSIPREGHKVYSGEGKIIGGVTSGSFSPTLEKPIALAYIINQAQAEVEVEIRKKRVKGKVVPLPFYQKSGRTK